MSLSWKHVILVALAFLAPALASAQLAPPVARTQQDTDPAGEGAAAAQVAIPPTELTPYRPDSIETRSTPPSDPARAGTDKSADFAIAPPSEFEAFVSSTVGKPLRRFGSELLLPGARDFAVPATTAVPPDYRLNPGDELLLGITGSVQASELRLIIDSEGRIFVPRIGAIRVGGVRYGDVHGVIERQVSRQYRGFQLEISVGRLRGVTVYVTGFAARPGSYSVGSLSTLVNAVLAAGGPASGGSFRSIQLRRGGTLIADFDLYDLLLKGDRSGDAVLQNGDVLYIAPAGEQVAVIGSVNREAIFEVAPGETLADAILYAGGVNTVADADRLMVFDSLGRADAGWQQLSAAEAQTRKARRGDLVRVLSNIGIARPLRQQPVLVTIGGEVARPGRYYFNPGTRLDDAIAEAGGLTHDAFPFAAVVTRESVKHQQRLSYDRAIDDVQLLLTAQPATSANRAEMTNPASLALVNSIVEQLRRREPTGRLVFDLPVTATALPAGIILENNDTLYVPPRPTTVGVFGAVPSPASFAWRDGQTIGDFVVSAGGVQKLGDKGQIFVVRANGTVLAGGRRALRAPALPGDLVYVPIKASRGELLTKIREITGSLFGTLVGGATIKALIE